MPKIQQRRCKMPYLKYGNWYIPNCNIQFPTEMDVTVWNIQKLKVCQTQAYFITHNTNRRRINMYTSMLLPLCNALEITVNEFLSCEKILPENYSMKAEENMMALIEENKRTKKGTIVSKIMGCVVVCISLIFMLISNTGFLFPINNLIFSRLISEQES